MIESFAEGTLLMTEAGGKLLADRGLSRLLGPDWPRTLDELEALKRR